MNGETLFRALSDVGDDLLELARTRRFSSPWKKWLTAAAVIALVLCLGAVTLPYFPMGCGSAQAPEANEECTEETMPMEEEGMPAEEESAADEVREVTFEGRIYVLADEPTEKPADLGSYLGLTDSGAGDLSNLEVYAAGEGDIYVRTEAGYTRAAPKE